MIAKNFSANGLTPFLDMHYPRYVTSFAKNLHFDFLKHKPAFSIISKTVAKFFKCSLSFLPDISMSSTLTSVDGTLRKHRSISR